MKILSLLLIVALVGCTQAQVVTCPLEQTADGAIASELNTLAACSNSTAIVSQLEAWEVPLKLCPASGLTAGIPTDLCVALIPIIESAGNDVKYLQAWGCDLTKASSVTALLTQACGLLAVPARKVQIHLTK